MAWLRRRFATIVVVVLIAAMVAGSMGPLASRRPAPPAGDDNAETATQPETPSPFAGTPALQFADGEAGLVLPSATPVEGFDTAEVALALHAVRRALIHGNVDEVVTTGVSLAPYLDVVGPETGARVEQVLGGHAPGETITDYVTRFPREGVEVAGDLPVKVAGSFRYRAAGAGVLAIDSRHIFAYPAAPARGDTTVELVVVRREITWRIERTASGLAAPEIVTSTMATSGHCLADDGGFVWPRFTAPDHQPRAGEGVPVDWNIAEPLVAGTDCFLPIASRA